MPTSRARFVALTELLARHHPTVPIEAITEGRVLVDGRILSNPRARVRADASLRVLPTRRLRGDIKLSYALDTFEVAVAGRVAVDVGASSGGFTTALLDRGAARVYAIDAGTQLVGWLRNDDRVVNLENRNLGSITEEDIGEPAELITVDLSYLSLAAAVPQLEQFRVAGDADLVALVKPTFELRLSAPPTERWVIRAAVEFASTAINANGWTVVADIESAVRGAGGSVEHFIHARRMRVGTVRR